MAATLHVVCTPAVRAVLAGDGRGAAWQGAPSAPLALVRALALAQARPLHVVLAGSALTVPTPPLPRKDAVVEARLARLRRDADERAYAAMVRNVEPGLRSGGDGVREYRVAMGEAGIGVHVLLTCGAAFLFAYSSTFYYWGSVFWVRLTAASCYRLTRAVARLRHGAGHTLPASRGAPFCRARTQDARSGAY